MGSRMYHFCFCGITSGDIFLIDDVLLQPSDYIMIILLGLNLRSKICCSSSSSVHVFLCSHGTENWEVMEAERVQWPNYTYLSVIVTSVQ